MNNLRNTRATAIVAVLGVVVHHFGNQLLNRTEKLDKAAVKAMLRDSEQVLQERNHKEIVKLLQENNEETIKSCEAIMDTNRAIWSIANNPNSSAAKVASDEAGSSINAAVGVSGPESPTADQAAESVMKILSENDKIMEAIRNSDVKAGEIIGKNLSSEGKKVLEFINSKSGGKNYIGEEYVQSLYDYLNNLSLLQESALIHILIFMLLFLVLFNILGVLFGNEVIKYLDLENKFPKISLYFKLRLIYQRYYLIWSTFLLFSACFLGIAVNLLVLSTV